MNLHTANHNKAQINSDNQTTNLERLEKLRASGAVSSTTFDEAAAAQQAALAEVAATKAQLGGATTSLKRSTLRAPFDGRITERLVTDGDFARVGTVLYHILDDSTLRFRAEVPERQASRVNESTAPQDEKSIFDGVDTTFSRLAARKPDASNGTARWAGGRSRRPATSLQNCSTREVYVPPLTPD